MGGVRLRRITWSLSGYTEAGGGGEGSMFPPFGLVVRLVVRLGVPRQWEGPVACSVPSPGSA